MSAALPPIRLSRSSPPSSESAPSPPLRLSLPSPPLSVFAPALPVSTSPTSEPVSPSIAVSVSVRKVVGWFWLLRPARIAVPDASDAVTPTSRLTPAARSTSVPSHTAVSVPAPPSKPTAGFVPPNISPPAISVSLPSSPLRVRAVVASTVIVSLPRPPFTRVEGMKSSSSTTTTSSPASASTTSAVCELTLTWHSLKVGLPVSGSVFGGQVPDVAVTVAAGRTTMRCRVPSRASLTSNVSLPAVPVTVIWPLRVVPPRPGTRVRRERARRPRPRRVRLRSPAPPSRCRS